LRAKQDGAKPVVIEVADTGIGITTKDIPKLFERFSEFDQRRHLLGKDWRLGLSRVKELVTITGGEINVISELNHGTGFTTQRPVTLPHPKRFAVWQASDPGSAGYWLIEKQPSAEEPLPCN
jgi:signal transduction histidine kinase